MKKKFTFFEITGGFSVLKSITETEFANILTDWAESNGFTFTGLVTGIKSKSKGNHPR